MFDQEKTANEQHRECNHQDVEVTLDERLDFWTEEVDHPAHQEEPCRAGNERCQHKYGKIDLKSTGRDSKYLEL